MNMNMKKLLKKLLKKPEHTINLAVGIIMTALILTNNYLPKQLNNMVSQIVIVALSLGVALKYNIAGFTLLLYFFLSWRNWNSNNDEDEDDEDDEDVVNSMKEDPIINDGNSDKTLEEETVMSVQNNYNLEEKENGGVSPVLNSVKGATKV
jgi:hypothetical protein